MKKNYMYIRVSTARQAEKGIGLDVQHENNIKYLIEKGLDPNDFEEIVDGGKSAKSLNRTGMNRLLKEMIKDKVDKIIFYKLDRLSRDVSDTNNFIKLAKKHKVELLCVRDNVKIKTANERAIINITASINQIEREQDAERVAESMIEKTKQGYWIYGKHPFGFRKHENLKLYIYEPEAIWVRVIFKLSGLHYSDKQIADYLNEEQALGKVWDSHFVHDILKKTIYYGTFQGIENFVDAIVTKEEFDKAHGKRRIHKSKVNVFKYANKVICAICGNIVGTDSSKKGNHRYLYYYCEKCNKRIRETLIDEQISPFMLEINESKKNTQKNELSNKIKKLTKKRKNAIENI